MYDITGRSGPMPCFPGDNLFFFIFLNGTVGHIRAEFRQKLLGRGGGKSSPTDGRERVRATAFTDESEGGGGGGGLRGNVGKAGKGTSNAA